MKHFIILVAAFFYCLDSNSQDMPLAKGIWFSPEELRSSSFDWQAQWIWLDEKEESDVMLARYSFDSPTQGASPSFTAQIRITATSQYQLYLNGRYLAQGPARSAPHHQSFDIWEVGPLLQEGKNTLAVRVHHQDGKYAYHFDGRAGLLAQLDIVDDQDTRSHFTDSNWKTSPDPSWGKEPAIISRFQLVVNDRVDLRQEIKGWNSNDFDDSAWSNATPLFRKVGWPSVQRNARAQALTPPWTSLIPRDLPYLIEKEERALHLIEASVLNAEELAPAKPIRLNDQIDNSISKDVALYQKGEGNLRLPAIPDGKKHFLLFDFGTIRNGMPQLDIEGPAGTKIEIRCAPFIVDQSFSHQVVFSNFQDEIILSGTRDQWEATYWKPTRYMALVIENRADVQLHRAGIRHLAYPFEEKGSMHSSDAPWVRQYMAATAKTIDVCTTDGYTDNYRERRQYAQTGYYGAMGNYWIYGDHSLQRRYLVQVSQEQEANGMMPAYAPLAKDDFMIIMDSNCLWIRSLRDYFLHSGDELSVQQLLPAARKLMTLLHSYTNQLGLIDNPPYPYWLDHALIDRRGANLNLNGHYLGALEDFAEVLRWLNDEESTTYEDRAQHLRQSIRQHFWEPKKQRFADALIDGQTSELAGEHGNAMALAMNIATPEQAQLVAQQLLANDELTYVKRASGMTVVTPAMSYFLHKGLANYGYIDESLALFRRRFNKMLLPNTNQTLFEEWWLDKTGRSGKAKPTSRSDAQTESCFPPALFGEFLLGVKPTQPGMKEVEIYRTSSLLTHIEGQVPSPYGLLRVTWTFEKTGGELKIDIPKGMQVKLHLNSLKTDDRHLIQINNRTLSATEKKQPYTRLDSGKYVIEF